MITTLNPQQQKYYLAAFSKLDACEYSSNNKIKLYQFSDVHCKTTNEVNPVHNQFCDEITFVTGGEGTVGHNDRQYELRTGDIHLCFKGDNHQPRSSKHSPMKFYCIGFTLDPENPLFPLRERVRERIADGGSAVIGDMSGLSSAFQTILNIFSQPEFDHTSEHIVTSTLNYIISTVFSSLLGTRKEKYQNMSMNDSLVLYIVSFLRNNVFDPKALGRLSPDTGYSYSYLSHVFSRKMGESLKSFFYTLRMNIASEMLKEKSVTEVADALGYSSIHSFSKAYKNFHTSSPKNSK
ncbi:MAG: helix-turn-helix transcriptional regulator [Clostridia bacterium]|nr:helix-turn-helix transcriptional regulator [Clostridia bacterium]